MGRRAAIVGLAGTSLSAEERALLRDAPPLGVVLFRRNIAPGDTPAALAASVRDLLGPDTLVMVDQEGGRVARLVPPRFGAHPPAAAIGACHARDPAAGERAAFLTGALIGLDCRDAGIDLVAAPVLDRRVPGADPVIGDRAFGADPEAVARLAGAVADGLLAAGCQPIGKHAPGHGPATVDSHLALPELDALAPDDLAPFRALASRLPWMMTAHLRVRALDPMRPVTLSPHAIAHAIRGVIGFDGVLVSDDLTMGALDGTPGARTAGALLAGCDVALHCSGVLADTRDVLGAARPLDARAEARLRRAAHFAAARRVPLDAASLRAERDALLPG